MMETVNELNILFVARVDDGLTEYSYYMHTYLPRRVVFDNIDSPHRSCLPAGRMEKQLRKIEPPELCNSDCGLSPLRALLNFPGKRL